MKLKTTNLQTRLYLISFIILLLGMGGAILIYLTAGNGSDSVDERDSRRIIRYGREGEYFLAWQAVGLSTQAPSQNFSRLAGNERHFFGIDVETPKYGEMRARSATRDPGAFSRTLKALPARRRCTLRRFGGADDLQPC